MLAMPLPFTFNLPPSFTATLLSVYLGVFSVWDPLSLIYCLHEPGWEVIYWHSGNFTLATSLKVMAS